MNPVKRVSIGKMLLDSGLLTSAQLDVAIERQRATGERLGQTLINLGFIDEKVLLQRLADQLNIALVDIRNRTLDTVQAMLLPEMLARRYRAMVIGKTETGLLVGMADPQDVVACDELEKNLRQSITIALVREADLLHAIDMVYRRSTEITSLAEELSAELIHNDFDIAKLAEGSVETDAPVLKLLQSIFEDGVQAGASDIHIEPDEVALRIRHRVDGLLQEQVLSETHIASALTLRLKLMAGLNITERRLPQDGRFSIRVHNKNFDVRLSTLPVQYGESVVMRLLDQSADAVNLDRVGMPAMVLQSIRRMIQLPHGILLVTGPTGSGKTTTLYGVLAELNQADTKIITVEDPVEYRMSRISQVQVQNKIDLSFARVLRAILRQDPDVIMIGELRDQETANIALRAAMTGHFVLSTLHTNDAASSVVRLLDMGAEGYIVASVLRGVLAQRLVRRICQNCIETYELSLPEKAWLTSVTAWLPEQPIIFKRGAGCHYCHNTGYKGRCGIFEILEITAPLADALRLNDLTIFMRLVREAPQFRPLVASGVALIAEGVTTLEEVIRMVGEGMQEDVPALAPVQQAEAMTGSIA